MTAPACPPSHQPVTDDEIAWVVVTLHRTGMGQVGARCLHLRDEGEAHDVATTLAKYGPTWMLGLGDEDDHNFKACRYGGDDQ